MEGEVSFVVDDARERVTATYRGAVSDDALADAVARLLAGSPQIVRYDSLTDLRLFDDVFTSAGMDELARRWAEAARHADRGTRTALVFRQIRGRTFIWSLALRYPNRDFEVFTSMEAAEQWLDEGLARRRAAASPPEA